MLSGSSITAICFSAGLFLFRERARPQHMSAQNYQHCRSSNMSGSVHSLNIQIWIFIWLVKLCAKILLLTNGTESNCSADL